MRHGRTGSFVVAGLTLAACVPAARGEILVESSLTGGYQASGAFANSPAFQNYRVGRSPITTDPERRNFFVFDLTTLAPMPMGSIAGGSLNLYLPKFAPGITLDPGFGYVSPDPFEVYRVSSTPFTADELADPTHTVAEATAIYGTLGTGALMGEVVVSPADMGTFVEIPLTPAAVMAINGMMGSGKLACGGRITSLSFIPPDELLFGFTDSVGPHMAGKMPYLSLTVVPGPGAAVVVMGGAMVAARRRRG